MQPFQKRRLGSVLCGSVRRKYDETLSKIRQNIGFFCHYLIETSLSPNSLYAVGSVGQLSKIFENIFFTNRLKNRQSCDRAFPS